MTYYVPTYGISYSLFFFFGTFDHSEVCSRELMLAIPYFSRMKLSHFFNMNAILPLSFAILVVMTAVNITSR